MPRSLRAVLLACSLALFAVPTASAQGPDWRPPSRQMPRMPTRAELDGDWLSSRRAWFEGVEAISGVAVARLRAGGEVRPSSDVLQVARFMNGPVPVVVWSDRDGDSRADMIEIFRAGGVVIQLIDADYDGAANVLRVYNAAGALVREERM